MKRKYMLVVLAILSIMALAYFASTAKADYTYEMYLSCSKSGNVWQFTTTAYSGASFSSQSINTATIVATYWVPDGTIYTVKPREIYLKNGYVKLYFDQDILPSSTGGVGGGAAVTGSLFDGSTFRASGPGWVWSNHG
jgi:hypothetical protein